MFALGLVAGYFLKNQWNKRNSLASADNAGLNSLPPDTNNVLSQKNKDCEAQANKTMGKIEFAVGTDLVAYKKQLIDSCMKDTGIR